MIPEAAKELVRMPTQASFNEYFVLGSRAYSIGAINHTNDLGFYASLDRLVGKFWSFELESLWAEVRSAWNKYDSSKLSSLFDLRAKAYDLVDANEGKNEYVLPHGKKAP